MPILESEYTTEPTHIRVFSEGDGWAIDGSDGTKYTEQVWKYDTQPEAIAAIPEFIEHLTVTSGHKFFWRPAR